MLKQLLKNEAKTMTKHISCNCSCKFIITTCRSNQKWNNKTCQCECKNYHNCRKDYSWNPSTCICENRKCFKNIADTSVIACDEVISVMDIVSTEMTNTIATNVTKNCQSKKVRDCYILHTVLLVIILLLMMICCHYAKKGINALKHKNGK